MFRLRGTKRVETQVYYVCIIYYNNYECESIGGRTRFCTGMAGLHAALSPVTLQSRSCRHTEEQEILLKRLLYKKTECLNERFGYVLPSRQIATRYRWLIVGLWMVAIAVALPFAPQASQVLHPGGFVSPDAESQRAINLLSQKLHLES